MRISDWSSDMCSSDLQQADAKSTHPAARAARSRRVHALTSRLTPNSLIKPTAGGISRPKCRPGAQAAARCAPPPPITADSTDDLEALPRRQAAQSQCRSEEHTSELQSLMRISYAVFCLKKKKKQHQQQLRTPKKQHQTQNAS